MPKSRTLRLLSIFIACIIGISAVQPSYALSEVAPFFNNPQGSATQKANIRTQLRNNIRQAKKGDYIRIASFAFHDRTTKNLLVRAHNRGVKVQVIVSVTSRYGVDQQIKELQKLLGSDVTKGDKSWVVICKKACRGGPESLELHSKIYLFSRNKVAYVGSANLTNVAVSNQWNEMIRVRNDGVYNELLTIFNEMKLDKKAEVRGPYRNGKYQIISYPRNVTRQNDHLLDDLEKVRCSGATGRSGIDGHTVVYISQYAWSGTRGVYLAERVAEMHANGCKVFIVLGEEPGDAVDRELKGVPKLKYDPLRGAPYNHEKWMAVSGRFGDQTEKYMLWTGSLNWTDRSELRDEISVRVDGDRAMFSKYEARIKQLKAKYNKASSHRIMLGED